MKNLVAIMLIIGSFSSEAQIKYYKDSSFNQSFNLLSGSTQLIPGVVWDDPDFSAPIGFMFHMFNDSSNTFYSSSDFGTGCQLTLHPVVFGADSVYSVIMALGSDLIDRGDGTSISQSAISYKTEGTAPNRIFKIEWKRAGFFNPFQSGDTDDSLDLQLWLYEGSNIIETRIGNANLVSTPIDLWESNDGPFIGIADTLAFSITGVNAVKGYNFKGPITNPSLDSFTNLGALTSLPGMIGTPTSGMVFRFIPRTNNGVNVGYETIVTYVEPSFNYLKESQVMNIEYYQDSEASYEIVSSNGGIIQKGTLQKGKNKIQVNEMPSGLYILRMQMKQSSYHYKFTN